MAENGYSQNARVNIKKSNVQLDEVLNEIENQTDYLFVYNNLVNSSEKVSVNSRNKKVKEVLTEILDNSDITFQMEGTHIILSKKDNNPDPSEVRQERKNVTGIVTDGAGEPLPGVSISVAGTNLGTTTNPDGSFSISVPNDKSVLQFNYIGYTSQNITVGDRTKIDIKMVEDTQMLEEVVVIGYGTIKKKDLTGAVGSLGGDALVSRKTTQISQALQGALSGVTVTRDNNAPGASATIRIRGITTIGNTEPLIIVDGMQVDNINDVNPNDIENISVLKDAASSSIYGSQAAAGVILVTTKRAKTDQFNLEYNFEYGMEIPTASPEFVNPQRYMQMTNELRWNDAGNGTNEYPTYSKDVVDNYYQLNREDPNKYPITDWMGLMLKSYAPRESHILKINGGTKALKTSASFGYDKIGALYEGRTYDRITSRINNDLIINKFLAASLDVNFKNTSEKQPPYSPLFQMRMAAPVYAATWSDGRYAEGKNGGNVYARTREGGFSNSRYNQLGAKIGLDLTPLDGLKLSGIFSPVLNTTKQKTFRKATPWTLADDPTTVGGYIDGLMLSNLAEVRNDNYRLTTQFLANYSKTFSKHSLDLMAGYENRYEFNENLGASRQNYDLDSYPYLDLGPLELRDNNGSAYEYARRSFFGRIMYNYDNKYLLQANIRYDASSRFDKKYRWGSFPSVSAGWVISEENFMKDQSWLSFLKLRASYGTLGNERIGNYPYQATIAFENAFLFQGNNVVSQTAAAQQQYAIKDISWETTESYDIGLDANLLNNKLRFSGDYYKKTTKGMLLALQIPTYMGFDNPDQNTGKMHTTGWEISAGWYDKIGDVDYSIDVNLSDFKSVMGDLGGTEFLGDQIKVKGSEFNEWYGYKSNGLFQTQDDVKNAALISSSVKPGDIQFVDISGPDGVPDGRISPEYDRVKLGGSLPRYTYGGNIRLDYKDFDFGVTFQGVGKQNARIQTLMVQPLLENWGHIPALLDGNVYSQYNTAEQNLAAQYPRLTVTNPGSNYTMSDFWMFDGSYFRLKNINVGYTVPKKLANKILLQNLRIYASASDLFCLSQYPHGWDPEMGASAYPITTSIVFGISVKF
ncbi:SusC/RagA family TonB-linked outer membrane protein [Bacteroidia bacterium]|nr:SusC/RagA family TonB-linked outer membrane protein [Bacteroidia bacterium]GHV20082.1 SusC/RagA family TonB-linked outer membrane protein [Bacteroidia bacterium]